VIGNANDDGGLKEFTHFSNFDYSCSCGVLGATIGGPLVSGPTVVPLPLDASGKAMVSYAKNFGTITPKGDCRGKEGCISNEFFDFDCSAKNYADLSVTKHLRLILMTYE